MKMVSRFALAAMLSLGAVSFAATPAVAQKSKKDKGAADSEGDAQKKLLTQISPEYRKPAAAAEEAIKAKDWATADAQLTAAEALAKNDAERFFAAGMRLTIAFNTKNDDGMAKALEALIANPNTSPSKLSYYNFLRGEIPFRNKRRQEALPFLLKARELGSTEKDLPIMIAQAYFDTNNTAKGVEEMSKAMDAERAAGRKPPEEWYKYLIAKVYTAGDRTATANLLMRRFQDYPSLQTWRLVVVLYRDSKNKAGEALDRRQKIDLFRLMRATGALADANDYVDYAQAALNSGLPWETIAVIDEGRKSGKLPQTEADSVKLYAGAQTGVRDEGSLENFAKQAKAAATGKEALNTGDAFLASGNYARAVEMYDLALQKGSTNASQVNLNRGVALFQLGRKDEARQAFAQVQGAPLSDVARFWTVWIDLPAPPTA